MVEPWLRGTLTEVDAVRRQVLHVFELAAEDAERWCAGLSDAEMNARPFGVASERAPRQMSARRVCLFEGSR